MKPNVDSPSTFPWRRRIGDLAEHGDGGRKMNGVRIHGGLVLGREDGGDGRREKNGEKEDEDEVEVKECDK